jgi:hypothetical protein
MGAHDAAAGVTDPRSAVWLYFILICDTLRRARGIDIATTIRDFLDHRFVGAMSCCQWMLNF